MKSLDQYLEILQNEPAPSPYSGILKNYAFQIDEKPLKWKRYWLDPKNKQDDSRIMLVDENNRPWLILNYGCYIKALGDSKVLIWYCSTDPKTREYFIVYFDMKDLSPIELKKAHKVLHDEIKNKPKTNPLSTVSFGFYANFKNEPIKFTIPNKLSQGNNSYNFPKGFDLEKEQIIHGYYQVNSHNYKWDYNPWINPFCILLLKTYTQEIEIICVDWFNMEEWDLDYQWICRIAREPKTQKFIGEGIRMGIFELGKTGKKLEQWIFREDFYMYPTTESLNE